MGTPKPTEEVLVSFEEEQPLDVYRVQLWRQARWPRRTWQAEWPSCRRAPRAFTRRGVEKKARRWRARERSTS